MRMPTLYGPKKPSFSEPMMTVSMERPRLTLRRLSWIAWGKIREPILLGLSAVCFAIALSGIAGGAL